MSQIRALHELTVDQSRDAELVEYATRLREEPGCVEAECYRSEEQLDQVAMVALWEDQYAYAEHWARVLEGRTSGHGNGQSKDLILRAATARQSGEAGAEFYRHQPYLLEGTWLPPGHKDREAKICWPASGPVRIICQNSQANVEEITPALLDNARETRREPGCLQFAWLRSIEFPDHMLLLELWHDQALYDAHWLFRIKTGSGALPSRRPAPRQHGGNGLEFYQHQPFAHLYDRWQPVAPDRWSETVTWAG